MEQDQDQTAANGNAIPADVQGKLDALKAMFIKQLPDKLDAIQQTMRACLADGAGRERLVTLHRHVHSIAGSAGTFGFHAAGARARALETLAQASLMADDWRSGLPALADGVRHFMEWMAGQSGEATEPEKVKVDFLDRPASGEARLLYLVDADPLGSADLATALGYFGFSVAVLPEPALLGPAIARRHPAAILISLELKDGKLGGTDEITRLRQMDGPKIPTIFLSNRIDFAAQLAAVRLGTGGYFVQPVDVAALTDRIDFLTLQHQSQAYRILIVDDDRVLSAFYATVLRGAGMEVQLLHEPSLLLSAMSEFNPELVVMDVYMPDCNGVELAQVIRLNNRFIDVPIVFLSTERDFGKQLSALQFGADDFISKPIDPEHLVSSLRSRGARYRSLRNLIMRDSLTGLFNHASTKETLARELSLARRNGGMLSLAMIDIDFFKSVNDTHGHPVGDHVLRTLSRLLQQRLRRSDIIGRYGGEEFAVILHKADADTAKAVLDPVREAFSKIRHLSKSGSFSVTFSAGVADFGQHADEKALFAAADEALYQAKHGGRNQVAVWTPQASAEAGAAAG